MWRMGEKGSIFARRVLPKRSVAVSSVSSDPIKLSLHILNRSPAIRTVKSLEALLVVYSLRKHVQMGCLLRDESHVSVALFSSH